LPAQSGDFGHQVGRIGRKANRRQTNG
jgi:hypothetical protein